MLIISYHNDFLIVIHKFIRILSGIVSFVTYDNYDALYARHFIYWKKQIHKMS